MNLVMQAVLFQARGLARKAKSRFVARRRTMTSAEDAAVYIAVVILALNFELDL